MASPFISEMGSALGSGLSGLSSGLGSAIGSGLGGLTKLLSHDPQKFAKMYFQADGSFETPGGPSWMDYSFAGSGPDRQDWSTTSEDYVEDHERGRHQKTWMIDNDGDVTTYNKRPPQQKKANGDIAGSGDAGYGSTGGLEGGTLSPSGSGQGLGGSFAHAESSGGAAPTMGTLTNTAYRQADAFHPSERGFFNPNNPSVPVHKDPTQAPPKKTKPGQPPVPGQEEETEGIGSANTSAGVGEGLETAEEVAPLLAAASVDNSDIVRQFQASGGGCIGNPATSSGPTDDSIAKQAQRMLRTAGRNYTPAEQRELEEEFHPKGARNLGALQLGGTHYEDD
jgi:hypothetical protein